MTDHVNLRLTPRKAAAMPKLIISLGRRYVQYINKRIKRARLNLFVLYDNQGRVQNQSSPCLLASGPGDSCGTAYWTTTGYDALDRPTVVNALVRP